MDNKDSPLSTGQMFPPPPFVTEEFLGQLSAALHPGGVVAINVGYRDTDNYNEVSRVHVTLTFASSSFCAATWTYFLLCRL